jgi:DNA-binding response OmpR family regulator
MSNGPHCRIMVVEDEALLAMQMELLLAEAGLVVVGPAASVAEAIELAKQQSPDVALLDINLSGQKVFPVADVLAAADTPFIFLSGHSRDVLPERYGDAPFLQKPCEAEALLQAVDAVTGKIRNADRPDGKHDMELAHLREADDHILDAHHRVARQSALIQRLEEDGQDTREAKSFLRTMHDTLEAMEKHHLLIKKEVAAG